MVTLAFNPSDGRQRQANPHEFEDNLVHIVSFSSGQLGLYKETISQHTKTGIKKLKIHAEPRKNTPHPIKKYGGKLIEQGSHIGEKCQHP